MRNFILFISLFLSLSLFSQSENGERVLSAKCAIQQTMGGVGYWQVSITNFSDPGGQVDATAIDTLDYVQFSDSGTPYALQVVGVVSAVGNMATVKLSNVGITGISSVPTTSNATWSRRTENFGLTPWPANITGNDAQLNQEYTMYKIDSILGTFSVGSDIDYITTDSFVTFIGGHTFASIAVNKTILRTTTGSTYRKSSTTNVTEVTVGNGLLATTQLTQSGATLTWNSNLNNRVGLNTGANASVTITNPTNLTSQPFGETFVIQVSTSTVPVTVVFDSTYSKFDFTAFGSVVLPARTEATYSFRVVKSGDKGFKLACTDDISGSSTNTNYITTDSFNTFVPSTTFAAIPIGSTVWRTTTGNTWQKTNSTTMTKRSLEDGTLAYAVGGTTTLSGVTTFNPNLNNRILKGFLHTTRDSITATWVDQDYGEKFTFSLENLSESQDTVYFNSALFKEEDGSSTGFVVVEYGAYDFITFVVATSGGVQYLKRYGRGGGASTITINPSNGVIPYRTSASTLADSPISTDGANNISSTGTATFGVGRFTTGIYDNAGTPKLSISPHNRTLYKANGTTPILNWGLDESLIWGDSAGVNQSHDTGGYSTGYPYPGNTIKGNVFIGNLAGKATTDDDEGDVFIGNGAGQFSVGAPQNPPNNTYVGLMSGQMNTNGYYNVYMGGLAGRANTNGYANVFVGWGSGHYQNTANNNYQTYVGVESGIWGGGNNNTCLGARSGMSTIFNEGGLGANNTMVGVYTGGSYNQSGVYAKINNTTLMGYFAGAVNRQDGLVAYGYAAGSNNSTGDLNTFIGYNSGLDNKTGSNNTLLGYSAGAKIKGSGLTAIGTYAGRSDTIGNSVYIGYLAGFSNVTGTNNVHIGSAAGQNSTSSENVFIGNLAGRNTTGASNTFVGYQAGINNTAGAEGTYFGRGAGYANTTGVGNVLIGEYAGQSITTNSNLVALGRYAASANTGGNSVHLGYLSGFSNVTGTGNVFLGNYSGRYETGSNSFYVDSQERGNIAGGKAGALMYGTFDANPANQHLQINADIRFGGSTSAFPSLKYSGDKIQARLADGSGYTDIEVATEAYGAPWNGSNEAPTKDAIYDKIETIVSSWVGSATSGLDMNSFAISEVRNVTGSDLFLIATDSVKLEGDNSFWELNTAFTRLNVAGTNVLAWNNTDRTFSQNIPDNTIAAYNLGSTDGNSFVQVTTTNTAPRMILGSNESGAAIGLQGIHYEEVQAIVASGSFTATKSTISVDLASTGTVNANLTGWPTATTVASVFTIINVDAVGAGVDVTVALTGATWHSGSNPVLTPGQSVNCKLINGVLYIL